MAADTNIACNDETDHSEVSQLSSWLLALMAALHVNAFAQPWLRIILTLGPWGNHALVRLKLPKLRLMACR